MWVRSSTTSYGSFNLDMDRSPGFGSTPTDSGPLKTWFPYGSAPEVLNLASKRNSPDRSTKSTRLCSYGTSTACRHRVSGSLSLPSRGSFHLSLTVLYSIGHMVVFSLRRWSSFLPSGFLVSRRTPDSCSRRTDLSSTGLLPSLTDFSKSLRLGLPFTFRKSLPDTYFYMSFGLFRFRSPLLSESFLLSFPPGN